MLRAAVLSVLSVLFVPLLARGQDLPAPIAERSWGVQAGVLDGGSGEIAVVKLLAEKVGVGLGVGFRTRSTQERFPGTGTEATRQFTEMVLRPSVRRYLAGSDELVPFLTGSLALGYARSESDRTDVGGASVLETLRLNSRVGFGAEWFPSDMISLGGFTGLRVVYTHQNHDSFERDQWALDTFASSVFFRYFF